LNTPPEGTLDVLEELIELGVLERDELIELLLTLILELERELGVIEDDELERLELTLDTTLEELPQAAVTPKGEGWLAQVALEIQLLLFS
jgi:hypothetical protein